VRWWSRGADFIPSTWTQRFAGATLCGLLFMAVQLDWFGLAPGASQDLIVQATLLALVGSFALRVSPVGAAVGLALAFVAIFVDQATAGIGITPLRFAPPPDFWFVTLPRVCLTWAAFPLLTWAFSRLAPPLAGGVAIGAALVTLPFIRYDPSPTIVNALLAPGPGRFVVLAVPWLALCVLTAVIATATLFLERSRPLALAPVVAALVAVTIALPLSTNVLRDAAAARGIALDPAAGGPLTEVSVRATAADPVTPIFTWDGERILLGQFLFPFRTGVTSRAALTFMPGVTPEVAPGSHQIGVQLGDDHRQAQFTIVPPSGLAITLADDRTVVVHGPANGPLRLLVDGPDGPELLDVTLDAGGAWRSPLALTQGRYRIIGQSGTAWNAMEVQ